MMRYAVRHLTRFSYDHPVRFARCNLHLQPIDWDGQRVEHYGLHVEPAATIAPGLAGDRAAADDLAGLGAGDREPIDRDGRA